MEGSEAAQEPGETRQRTRSVTAGVLVLTLGALLVAGSQTIPHSVVSDPLGPRFFPIVTGAALVVLAISLLRVPAHIVPDGAGDRPRAGRPYSIRSLSSLRPNPHGVRVAVGVFIVIGYLIALPLLGYIISTAVAAAFLMWLMGSRGWKTFLVVPVSVTIVLYVIFSEVLGIHLP